MQNGSFKKSKRSGQAMLIAVLSMSGAILGATTVAGLLMLYQLRASTDSEHSAQAVFSADAGLEWSLMNYYCNTANPPAQCPVTGGADMASSSDMFTDGASFAVTCSDDSDNPTDCADTSDTTKVVSIGTSLNSRRAFTLGFDYATSSLP